ncbi:MAG: amidohydrolase family protein [Acidimicrobiales bacterium]
MGKTAIISVDGHVRGSREQYRPYVPEKFLETYDESVKAAVEAGTPDAGNLHPDFAPQVQWDSDLRMEKLESIGVVGEVLFSNGQPFQANRLDDFVNPANLELGEVGRQVYNRWLADFCAKAPDRRRGQMSMSFADIDQAVQDVYWAKEHGLGGIALPGLTRGGKYYFDPELDPVWAACQETGLPISQHGGGFDPNGPQGSAGIRGTAPGFGAFMMISTENAFFSNRSLWMLIVGGVFDRFPELRATWIETQVHLIIPTITYLDKVCDSDWMGQWGIKPTIKRKPSDYFGKNIFIGLSPFSPRQDPTGDVLGKTPDMETKPGFHIGTVPLMYGVDFPHFETCFQRNMGEVATLVTTPILDDTETHGILFDTAADVYQFDVEALQPHIDRIGFEVSDVKARADEIRRDIPEFNIDHITGGSGGFGRAPVRTRA